MQNYSGFNNAEVYSIQYRYLYYAIYSLFQKYEFYKMQCRTEHLFLSISRQDKVMLKNQFFLRHNKNTNIIVPTSSSLWLILL